MHANGEAIHGEYSGTGNNQSLILYRAGHRASTARQVRTLAAKEQLVVTDVQIIVANAGTVVLYDDSDGDAAIDNGERIAGGAFGVNGGICGPLSTPHYCTPGSTPKVANGSSVQVDCIVHGFILGGS